jgi:hypothetical protein
MGDVYDFVFWALGKDLRVAKLFISVIAQGEQSSAAVAPPGQGLLLNYNALETLLRL